MGFLEKIFRKMEERAYFYVLKQIINPLMAKIDSIKEREFRNFFKVILDASARSLYGILFLAPSDLDFETSPAAERAKQDKNYWEKQMKEKSAFYKKLTAKEIDFWLRKVLLALVAYSYYFFSIEKQPPLVKFSYEAYWQRIFDSYNSIFGEKITKNDINHYVSGLKEDREKGYSVSGNIQKSIELMVRDYATIGTELLENIWHEKITAEVKTEIKSYSPPSHGADKLSPTAKKILFLGARIWKAHQQIVQPFLLKMRNSE